LPQVTLTAFFLLFFAFLILAVPIFLRKLKKKKTYYFRVRGVNGKNVGKWSAVKRVKVNK